MTITTSTRVGNRFARNAAVVAATSVALAAATMLQATPARADVGSLVPNKRTCGVATCTVYWSVDRTAALHDDWMETILGTAEWAGRLAEGKGQWGRAASIAIEVRSYEFEHMLSGAAEGGRCLIYKFPKVPGDPTVKAMSLASGWFSHVSINNSNCDQGPE
ncbi:hypothetical protein Ait01nite_014020 [Actinoplanes italicus]|uniref:Peptidase inhibitor family I36 n=1 Tax=Actinoplanes italicus TaxID=113567 RepID=A0A2T0KHC2_9ACTN|nr:hypothetical protein [Actinoplanes italicus]PRX22835.1 hypothetical protein CLV67_104363 [Actinoplanes italicus]GIE28357.1 hypothetical protein Ait01nite_014020 [Actinoplanes italicus]